MKPEDWLVSFPKSGNTWVRMLLQSYLREEGVCPTSFIDTGGQMFHMAAHKPLEELSLQEQVMVRPAALLNAFLVLGASHYLIKSHHAAQVVEGIPLFSKAFVRKVIYVVRDPRDVALSLAHHTGTSVEDAVRMMGNDRGTFQDEGRATQITLSWSKHVESWMGAKEFPVCIVSYESLHVDPVSVLAQLLDFLGVEEIREDIVEEAVEACHIDRLREKEAAGEIQQKSRAQDTFFRRGEAGAWEDELSPNLVRQVEEDHGEVMKRVGYHVETLKERRAS